MKINYLNTDAKHPKTSRFQLLHGRALVRRFCGWGLLLLLAGCTENPLDVSEEAAPAADGKVAVEFELSPGVLPEVSVKAAGTVDENIVTDIWIIQLNSDGTAQLQAPQYITAVTAKDGNYRVNVELAAQQSKVYFIANTHNAAFCNGVDTQAKVEALTIPTALQGDVASEKGVPMTGTWTGVPGETVGILGKVVLTRALCKVTFDLSTTLPATDWLLTINSIGVDGVPDKVSLFKDHQPSGVVRNYSPMPTGSENLADGALQFTIYLPECLNGTGRGTRPIDKNLHYAPVSSPMCIVVEMEIAKKNIMSGVTIFQYPCVYIICLGENNINDYNMRRNTHYKVKTVVNGPALKDIDTRMYPYNFQEQIFDAVDYTGIDCPYAYFLRSADIYEKDGVGWLDGDKVCADTFGAGWRMPTVEEIQMAGLFYNQTYNFFMEDNDYVVFNDNSYLTSTPDPNDPNYWFIFQNSQDITAIDSSGTARLRCVRDVY